MNPAIKGLIVVLLVSGLMWLGWMKYQDFLTQGSRPTEGTQILNKMEAEGVPPFSREDIHGETITLSDYKDRVVIINFWASWCDPCVEEFPSLIQLLDHYKGKVVLIAISADYTMEDLKSFLKAFKILEHPHIKVIWDKEQKIAKEYGTEILPESYILGLNNKMIRKITGIDKWYGPGPIGFFDHLLDSKNPDR